MEQQKIEGYTRGINLPWLEKIWLVPVNKLLPTARLDAPPGTGIITNAKIVLITFPPAAAYLDIVPDSQSTYMVKITMQQPGLAVLMKDFIIQARGMEFQVLALDRNGLFFEFGQKEGGLKIDYQYTNNSRAVTNVEFSGKLAHYKVGDSTHAPDFLAGRGFSNEFSIEFL